MSVPRALGFFSVVFFVVVLFLSLSHAQQSTTRVEFSVTDSAGYALRGATIEAEVAPHQRLSCVTDEQGRCGLPMAARQATRVTCRAEGFATRTVEDVARNQAMVTIALSPQTFATIVSVHASAGNAPVSTMDTKQAEEIEALPVWLRGLNSLVVLTPGATAPPTDDDRGQGISAMGSRTSFTNYTLDGIEDRDNRRGGPTLSPSLEGVAEVQVLAAGFSPEHGRTAGAQVVLTTRSGSEEFHGKVFDYARDEMGFKLGGPLVKHKAYFFVLGLTDSTPEDESSSSSVPQAGWLNGNFANIRGAGKDGIPGNADDTRRVQNPQFTGSGYTRVEFATPNVIPDNLISPLAKQLMGLIPSSENGKISNSVADTDGKQALARFDYEQSATTKLFLRMGMQRLRFTVDPDSLNLYMSDWPMETDAGRSAVLGLQRTTATTATQFHLGVNEGTGNAAGACNADYSLAVQYGSNVGYGCPTIAIVGYRLMGNPGQSYAYRERDVHGDAQASFRRGRLVASAGVMLSRNSFLQGAGTSQDGTLRFNGSYSGNSLADFLLGLPSDASLAVNEAPVALSRLETHGWVNTQWTVSPRFVLEVGSRLEHVQGFRTSTLASTFQNGAVQVFQAGDKVGADRTSIQPRAGFSYRLTDKHEVVLRGGAGVFRAEDVFGFLAEQLTGNPPYAWNSVFMAKPKRPDVENAAYWTRDEDAQLRGLQPKAPDGVVYVYSLGLEQSLPGGTFALAYNGSQGRHLERRLNLNEPLPTGALDAGGAPVLKRTYPQLGDIIYEDAGASSSYNAGQISYTTPMESALHLKVAYTLSRSIDSASSANDTNWLTPQYPQDIRNLGAERGLSDFQHKHQLMAITFIDLNRLSASRWTRNSLVGTTMIAASGIPFTPRYGLNRPDMISDPFGDVPDGDYFNAAAFVRHTATAEDPSYFGSLGRNALIGPGSLELNTSYSRSFQLRKNWKLGVRAEVFNLLDKRVGFPNYDLTSATAGGIRHEENQPRRFVAGASLEF